jgi:hypothetical protein
MAATADANITLTDIDFNGIKDSIKQFIGSKHEFKDYNFEGSAMSTLIDVLAYNTHYSAFYANMVANEMFLDSSVVRDSVVSHAKAVGYVPASKKAPKALVNVIFPSSVTSIPLGTIFVGRNGDETFNFITTEAHAVDSTTYTASSIPIYEGSLRAMTFVADVNNPVKYIIPQLGIDISYVDVTVQKSVTNTDGNSDTWTRSSDINEISQTTKAYWIQEVKNGYYEVYFGDDVVGQSVADANLITITYLVTNGTDANAMGFRDSPSNRTFTAPTLTPTPVVEVVSPADGGGDKETIENIKYYAPRAYQAQDRAVTAEDYKTIINRDYSTAESVYVWGGEDEDPPQYGKAFVCIKPKSGFLLTQEEKKYLTNTILKKKNMVSITPEIVDPEYLYVKYNVTTNYNVEQETRSATMMSSLIKAKVKDWSGNNLGSFDQSFRYSKFVTELDKLSTSIIGTDVSIKMERRVQPSLFNVTNYDIKFYNSIHHPHDGHMPVLHTTPFMYKDIDGITNIKCWLDDDGSGLVRMYKIVDGEKVYVNKNVGQIDYETGTISLKQFSPVSLADNYITLRFTVPPKDKSLIVDRNLILYYDWLDASSLTVNAIGDKTFSNSRTGY